MKYLLWVGLGGFLGSVLRAQMSKWLYVWQSYFPLPTLIVNAIGALFIGIILGGPLRNNNQLIAFIATGFCGGFTTFSAFANENLLLLKNGQILLCLIYAFGSLVFGIIGCAAGYLIGRHL